MRQKIVLVETVNIVRMTIDILTNENEIDLDDNWSWTLWKKVNNKFDLQRVVGLVYSLLTEMEERWSAFLLHVYCNRQQRHYIKEIRSQSTAIAQMEFSMNYTLRLAVVWSKGKISKIVKKVGKCRKINVE